MKSGQERENRIVGTKGGLPELKDTVGSGETTVQKENWQKYFNESFRVSEINLISDSFHSLAKRLCDEQ